jgi:hypothetical protein
MRETLKAMLRDRDKPLNVTVFGLCDPSGFYSLWTDERVFELATLPASIVVGSIAAGAWRPGLVGSAGWLLR